eukprot:scaffold76171_cov37-Phaeocystis_antarctica.AAC.2
MAMKTPRVERSRPCAHGETAETCPLPGLQITPESVLGARIKWCCRLRPQTYIRLRHILSDVSTKTPPTHDVGPALTVRM